MAALEARVRELVEMIQTLKRENAGLRSDLRTTRERVTRHNEQDHRWVEERADIKTRIEKVLGELDSLECLEGTPFED